MDKIALIIDAQKDFMSPDGALFVPGADEVAETLNEYLTSITMENGYYGLVLTADTHTERAYKNSEEAKEFPPHCIQGTDGFDFAIDLSKMPNIKSIKEDRVAELIAQGKSEDDAETQTQNEKFVIAKRKIINKDVFDMWHGDKFKVRAFPLAGEPVAYGGDQERDEFFDNLVSAGIDQVEVSGVASDYCVKYAIEGLLQREFTVTIYDNLVAGIDRDIHQIAEEEFSIWLSSGKLIIA